MATTIDLAQQMGEQRFVVQHVSWGTYECLLADHTDASTPRFTYSEGMLEIMGPSTEHEKINLALAMVAELVAEEREIEFATLGSTTFRRQDLEKGTEPDSCFYIQNVERIRGKKRNRPRGRPSTGFGHRSGNHQSRSAQTACLCPPGCARDLAA